MIQIVKVITCRLQSLNVLYNSSILLLEWHADFFTSLLIGLLYLFIKIAIEVIKHSLNVHFVVHFVRVLRRLIIVFYEPLNFTLIIQHTKHLIHARFSANFTLLISCRTSLIEKEKVGQRVDGWMDDASCAQF